jgi:hypothetical protein
MRKAHSIALAVVVALVAAAPAQADPPSARPMAIDKIVAQEQGRASDPRLFGPSEATVGATVNAILRQEEGRSRDPRLFAPSGPAPVLVAGPSEGFDFGDAAVGGAAAFALALLATAAVVMGGGRRSRSEGAAG